MKILIPTSTHEYDPTEVAVPWKIARDGGHEICFATDSGKSGEADKRMLVGQGFGVLKPLLITQKPARDAYHQMLGAREFQNPLQYDDINVGDFDGLILPGGHAKGIIPYLESKRLQKAVAEFFEAGKPVGAICHGVIVACRSQNINNGKSVLYGRRTTALLKTQEMAAYQVTRWNLGDYYRTYPITVEDEVRGVLQSATDFIRGPLPILRDAPGKLSRGFTVRDGNYLSARWPGDVYKFSHDYLAMLGE